MSSNSGASESAVKKIRRKPTKLFYAVALIGMGLLAILIAVVVIFPKQTATMRRLEAEKAQREQELLELKLQQEALRERVSLIGNQEFLIRYLREHQGYMLEGDIRLDLSNPNAVIPTPAPYVSESPTESPAEPLTGSPEESPSVFDPTDEPTEQPSVQPTDVPSGEPTGEP